MDSRQVLPQRTICRLWHPMICTIWDLAGVHLLCSKASTCTSHKTDTWVRMALRSVPSLSSQPFLLLTPNLDFYPSCKCHVTCIHAPPLASATCWSQCTWILTLGSGNVSAQQRPRQEHNTCRSWSFLAHNKDHCTTGVFIGLKTVLDQLKNGPPRWCVGLSWPGGYEMQGVLTTGIWMTADAAMQLCTITLYYIFMQLNVWLHVAAACWELPSAVCKPWQYTYRNYKWLTKAYNIYSIIMPTYNCLQSGHKNYKRLTNHCKWA